MLQRSEEGTSKVDCEDAAIAVACALDSDKCPAECKEDSNKDSEKEDTVVRSGDLAVTASAAEGKKALIGGTSDLDTVTFKTSEEVTISSITLERYGYSTKDQVETVQLEDEDGNIIADAKEINNKGQVKLNLKKDYKTVDGTFKATIVLNAADLTKNGGTNGSTIGFKVVSAESTAKNLNLDDYNPYTYDLVNYKGSAVEFSSRNSAEKTYSWEADKLYEVAKFRVKAPADAAILIKGFTLSDTSKKDPLDAAKYAKDVTVTVDGKEVKGLKWNINKDDELVVSFSEVEVEGKQTVTIAVNMSFTEEFDNFNTVSQYYIKQLSNFNAVDKKTETRVSQSDDAAKQVQNITWTKYTFKGGKVKISGSKLGTVNAAANATNVKVAEGEITVTETLRGSATIAVKSNDFIDAIRLVIAGEEYDGSKAKFAVAAKATEYKAGDFVTIGSNVYKAIKDITKTTYGTNAPTEADGDLNTYWQKVAAVYEFKGLEIEKSGKVEVRVDLVDNATDKATMEFDGSLNSASFDLQYEESRETVGSQLIGSISLSSVKIQAAKANLSKTNTTKVELVKGENNRKTIFDGTYTAKNGAVTLKNFIITSVAANGAMDITPAPTFYVTIDKEQYDADWSNGQAKGDIDNIEVADGKSVSVKVEIEVTPTAGTNNTFNIALEGEDEDSNKAGEANEDTVRTEVVTQGTIDVTNTSAKKTILLRSDRTVAQFTIKPSKSSDDDIILNTMNLSWGDSKNAQGAIVQGNAAWNELKFDINDDNSYTTSDGTFTSLGISVPAEGIIVKVTLKSELDNAKRFFKVVSINGKDINSEFSKYYVPATIKLTQNNGKGKDTTTYTAVVNNDTSYTVSDLVLYTEGACTVAANTVDLNTLDNTIAANTEVCPVASKTDLSESSEGNKLSANNGDTAHSIVAVSYKVNSNPIVIQKAEFENFFENAYGDDDLMVYSNKS